MKVVGQAGAAEFVKQYQKVKICRGIINIKKSSVTFYNQGNLPPLAVYPNVVGGFCVSVNHLTGDNVQHLYFVDLSWYGHYYPSTISDASIYYTTGGTHFTGNYSGRGLSEACFFLYTRTSDTSAVLLNYPSVFESNTEITLSIAIYIFQEVVL